MGSISSVVSFGELARRATGHDPYPYQQRLADDGLPEVLRVPTGGGKTAAATLPWLWRRRFHPDEQVRRATPRWLVYVLPMRVLVEQTVDVVGRWLAALGLTDQVPVHVVMGGEGRLDSRWRLSPEQDGIFVGTLDMLLSRALNRGYGESRFAWPIDFGLFHNGCQWVFDEVQLMGPGLPTSRQLEGLRRRFGTAVPSRSMWMSATIDDTALRTVDLPDLGVQVTPGPADLQGPLRQRVEARRRITEVHADPKRYDLDVATALVEHHRAGTLTLAILNTVERARAVAAKVRSLSDTDDIVLLHSRYRPGDRRRHTERALAPVDAHGPGRIVVSTQVVEAGVDISASVLFTEAAPWPSVIQRAGRCNRDGSEPDARLLWSAPPKPAPYHAEDVDATVQALRTLEDQTVDGSRLSGLDVRVVRVVHPVLRARDLLDLFDTTPDLSGNDVDVSRFIRAADDIDCLVAWRHVPSDLPDPDEPPPTREELCPVPIRELREALGARSAGRRRDAWRFDHLERRWVRLAATDLRPGQLVVLRAADGGYDPDRGWDPQVRQPVPSVAGQEPSPLVSMAEAVADDALSVTGRWVPLVEHLAEVEREARRLLDAFDPAGITPEQRAAAVTAARLHDIGKAHEVFQASMLRLCTEDERAGRAAGVPWAKSGRRGRLRHERPYFRHELASALALLGDAGVVLDGGRERDLVVYLVAAHHGRVRLGIRSLPDERVPDGEASESAPADRAGTGTHRPAPGARSGAAITATRRVALGVSDGDSLPEIEIPGGRLPPSVLDLSPMELGSTDGRPSWTQRALALRDRADLGPFRLGFLEAIVRLADWRASQDRPPNSTDVLDAGDGR